jgi:hypothetical protein
MTDMLHAALSYAATGLPVFPVSAAKIPFKGSAGHKDASTDPDRVRAMWHARPGAMIAVATGDRCGYCVLDIDTREAHGADGRATAKKLGLSFAGGVIALTPSGGWHVWFKTGGQALPSKNGLIGPGLDFKADGGYVVVPPSRPDPKKGGYQWINGSDLSAAAEVPPDIVVALRRKPHERDFLEACEPIRNAQPGTRRTLLNAAAFKFAFQVMAGKLEEKLYRDSLTNAALACGLDRITIDKTIDDALKDARAKAPGTAPGRGSKAAGTAAPIFALPDFDPWEEEVGAAELLKEIGAALLAYVSIDGDQAVALSLWVVHTHCIEATDYTPRLLIRSPSKRCGKSTLLRVIGKLVRRPLSLSGVSAAMLFRSIAAASPTLLLDEADNAGLKHNEDLRAVLNEGVYREAVIGRTVGEDHEPKLFPIFAPAALAGIGAMPATLIDRSVIIEMRRKLKSEKKQRFDRRRIDHLTELGRKAARFALDNSAALAAAEPDVPDSLNDRELDGWRPLLAIADLGGTKWAARARAAAVNLCGGDDDADDEPGLTLLADCYEIFVETAGGNYENASRTGSSITSAKLVENLNGLEARPWSEWGRMHRPISANGVARLLNRYHIRPVNNVGPGMLKGYLWAAFGDTWSRYEIGAHTEKGASP